MKIMENILFKCIFDDLRYYMNFCIYIGDYYYYYYYFHMYSISQSHSFNGMKF
jgi:hypothetical protein